MEKISEYISSLSGESQKRYECKVTSTGLKVDPYTISSWTEDPSMIPDVKWSDMVLYMVSTPSPYTCQEVKAWKGMLDGNNFMKSGWVHSLKLHQFSGSDGCNTFVIMGKVKHSQRMSATSLLPWVIVAEKGEVLAAHCTCMAGLGETCAHIAAVLSCLVRSAEVNQQSGVDSCTSRQCSWLPTARDVTPAAINKIVFKRKATSDDKEASTVSPKKSKVLPPSVDDINAFYSALNEAKHKPAILKITEPYHKDFIPKLSLSEFPMPITEAYNPATLTMNYHDLLKESEKVFESLKVTSYQVKKLEEETREQSSNKSWFVHRAGRITASNFKSVCHTNLCMPSQSLIKKICHPEAYKFSTEATRWGCEHESKAIQEYEENAKKNHEEIVISKAGLFVDVEKPYIGASPDGIIQCRCCGMGSLEVKCPFSCKDKLPDDNSSTFCMMKKDDDTWMLKRDHSYYYQVQTQLHVCRLSYGDFVVWSKDGILVERILKDDDFFDSHMGAVKHFFIYGILPEIVGKWYSRKPVADADGVVQMPTMSEESEENNGQQQDDHTKSWCYCNQPEFGEMIMCDNKSCTIKWFHFDCLRLRHAPKGKWYCPSCAKLSKYSKHKGK